ncbi:hypothetical protein AB0G04_40175 [Actinoplanes sp. NPDC023801]|uniref:hypothetical protein n=1 Tax=Actinoplanes sp. NPDC023801 TaxID=3154595 RepID=UPI0034088E72
MSERSHEQLRDTESSQRKQPADQAGYGSLTVEDDPDGTTDPTDLAGSANADDAQVGPAATEAD